MAFPDTPNRLEAVFIQRDTSNVRYDQINISGSDLIVYLDGTGSINADKIATWAAKYGIGMGGSGSAASASWATNSIHALSANFATNSLSASWASSSLSASYAFSASHSQTSSYALSSSYSLSSSYAGTASVLLGAVTSASYSTSSSYALTTSYALSSSYSLSSSNSISSSYVLSASYSLSASNGISSSYALTASEAIHAISASYFSGSQITASSILVELILPLSSSIGNPSASFSTVYATKLFGTASWATQSFSASLAQTASIANSISFVPQIVVSASWASQSLSSSYAATASVLLGSVTSASYAGTASVLAGSVTSASYALTSSYSLTYNDPSLGNDWAIDDFESYDVGSTTTLTNGVGWNTPATGSGMSIVARTMKSAIDNLTDNRLSLLNNADFMRKFPWGHNWHRLRIGICASISASATFTGSDWAMGVCSNTSSLSSSYRSSTTIAFIGCGSIKGSNATATFNTGTDNPYFLINGNSLFTRLQNTDTGIAGGVGSLILPAVFATGSNNRLIAIFDVARSTFGVVTYTVINHVTQNTANLQENDMGVSSLIESLKRYDVSILDAGHSGTGTTTFSEASGSLDTFNIWWNNTTFPIEISAIAAWKMR